MSRFYEPVAMGSGQFNNCYAVRGDAGHRHRVFGREMRLTWDQADRLCDILEEVREYAISEATELTLD